ncbi:MAG: MBL fold metallo-hydrolase [Desulfuromonadaceae bacterium]|nr:MBL fold metallo-hydrolase [Desulfuromonadaceae bacterium]
MVSEAGLKVLQIPAGEMKNFAYLIYCPNSGDALAVDPSFGATALLAEVERCGVNLKLVLNTHGHNDHLVGNKAVLAATGARLTAHPQAVPEADLLLDEGCIVTLGDTAIEVLYTPGHHPGHICLHLPGALVTGDTLFVTRVGRADLAGSDPAALYHSLRRLAGFPGETLVYPGHDYGPQPVSTIAYERQHNPFMRCEDLGSFLRLRMG